MGENARISSTRVGLTVGEKEGPGTFVWVERAFVNSQLSSVLDREAVPSEVVIEGPSVALARTGASLSPIPGTRPA